MMRWLATAVIAGFLVLDLWIPSTALGRRGNDPNPRADQPGAIGSIGMALPAFDLVDLDGQPISLEAMLGHRVLITFERSVDW